MSGLRVVRAERIERRKSVRGLHWQRTSGASPEEFSICAIVASSLDGSGGTHHTPATCATTRPATRRISGSGACVAATIPPGRQAVDPALTVMGGAGQMGTELSFAEALRQHRGTGADASRACRARSPERARYQRPRARVEEPAARHHAIARRGPGVAARCSPRVGGKTTPAGSATGNPAGRA